MIRVKVSELLGKHKMSRKDLSIAIGVRPNTIGDLYNEKIRKIDICVLNNLCKFFSCNVEDILEYVEDGDKE
ncbi:helix-turn-helix transcriptional regulator [Clostridium sp. KNHs214]|uniref:helix-turn-helix domain-containing protein n=1 Tax=Clostridium sp. KNHs214 TaxID=1540257 RepID=UPI0005519A1B|nr:helix-turn-helix transcriptional regulator [Clostridium sp. KNHs214]